MRKEKVVNIPQMHGIQPPLAYGCGRVKSTFQSSLHVEPSQTGRVQLPGKRPAMLVKFNASVPLTDTLKKAWVPI